MHILKSVTLVLIGMGCLLYQSAGAASALDGQDNRLLKSVQPLPVMGGCSVFPSNNIWNTRVDTLPLASRSQAWVDSIGRNTGFHMDFGSGMWDGGPIGIPYNIVGASVPKVPVTFEYGDESDPGPYPIPANPLIEYGSDRHP
jgi:hypothetical protein